MQKRLEISQKELLSKIKSKEIVLAGNRNLKIFGKLNCKSGKRMKMGNRVFFTSMNEAEYQGFRPCGNCMNAEYKIWKLKNA